MKMELQVTGPKLSLLLMKLGIPQGTSAFAWMKDQFGDGYTLVPNPGGTIRNPDIFDAFTSSEVTEFLPSGMHYFCSVDKKGKYCSWYKNYDVVYGDSEAESRGNMAVFLIRNKYMEHNFVPKPEIQLSHFPSKAHENAMQ